MLPLYLAVSYIIAQMEVHRKHSRTREDQFWEPFWSLVGGLSRCEALLMLVTSFQRHAFTRRQMRAGVAHMMHGAQPTQFN